ncbi:MAG: hypothetical protein HY066_09335 [Betaproteobacteria bacterium]|nr:hypothetical protein [Betaproteobacteria bacterium]
MNGKTIKESDQYTVVKSGDGSELCFTWSHTEGLGLGDFKKGIIEFVNQCKTHRPIHAVFDARRLDKDSPAFGWVSGQQKFEGEEEYMSWWTREVAPGYNSSKIATLGIATGNPEAPGEIPKPPPGVDFKLGYFNSLEDVRNWSPNGL